jgi:opacity protein-like surface antigen
MKIKYLLLTLGLVSLVTTAQAVELKPYVSNKLSFFRGYTKDNKLKYVEGVPTSGKDDENDRLGDKIAIGFVSQLSSGSLRTELEVGFNAKLKFIVPAKDHASEVQNIKIENITYTLNAYYDIATGTKFTPYFGFGLGIANLKAKSNYEGVLAKGQWQRGETEINNFIFNAGLGVAYAFSEKLSLDVGYKYTNLGTLDGVAEYKELVDTDKYKKSFIKQQADLSIQELNLGLGYQL